MAARRRRSSSTRLRSTCGADGPAATPRPRTVWVVRNGRMDIEGASVNRGLFSIARRSIATLLHFSGVGDISRIYLTAQRDGIAFRLSYIGSNFAAERREPFDQRLHAGAVRLCRGQGAARRGLGGRAAHGRHHGRHGGSRRGPLEQIAEGCARPDV